MKLIVTQDEYGWRFAAVSESLKVDTSERRIVDLSKIEREQLKSMFTHEHLCRMLVLAGKSL